MATMIGRVFALALATAVMVHADNCKAKWAWKEYKHTGAQAESSYCSSNDAATCITGSATSSADKCHCASTHTESTGDTQCCRDKAGTCQKVGRASTWAKDGGITGNTGTKDCSTHFEPDFTKRAMSVASDADANTWDSTCCKARTCLTATSLGSCSKSAGKKYKSNAASITCDATSCANFDTTCCEAAKCIDFKGCNEFRDQSTCPSYCTWSTSTSRCTGSGGIDCDTGKAFNDNQAQELFTTTATFKSTCCNIDATCTNRFYKDMCDSGFTYTGTDSITPAATAAAFNTQCCTVGETCASFKSSNAYTCDASVTAKATVITPAPSTAVTTDTLSSYRDNCCTAKATCSSLMPCTSHTPTGHVNALKAKSGITTSSECAGQTCQWSECCDVDNTKCEGAAWTTTSQGGLASTCSSSTFADDTLRSVTIGASSTYQAACCTNKATCKDWADSALITSPPQAQASRAPQEALSVLAAMVALLLMGKNL